MIGRLGILDGPEVLLLDKAADRFAVTVPTRLGGRMPAHSTALGKALLSTLEPSIVQASIRDRLPQLTARTRTGRAELHLELGRIRKRQGVAVDNAESVPGIACVAVPIRGRGAAAASVSLSGRISSDRAALGTARLARMLVEVANEASCEEFSFGVCGGGWTAFLEKSGWTVRD
ncbi:IclR family transcriptional regulator domain-containing protein [Nocardia sp. R6R-6]|uniref:IclR family transcriptional regulator domain-containing protein n=1 Tax=Nocardia sp. R6R-6 TaxID=3459303 RepID=UPI00403E1214